MGSATVAAPLGPPAPLGSCQTAGRYASASPRTTRRRGEQPGALHRPRGGGAAAPPGLTGAGARPCPNGRGRHSPHAARAQRPRREAGRLPPRPACRVHVIPPHAAKMAAPRAVNVLRGGGERAAAGRGGKGREGRRGGGKEGRRGAGSRRRPLNGAARGSPQRCCRLAARRGRWWLMPAEEATGAPCPPASAHGARRASPRGRWEHPAGWRGDSPAGPGRWHQERGARRRAGGAGGEERSAPVCALPGAGPERCWRPRGCVTVLFLSEI